MQHDYFIFLETYIFAKHLFSHMKQTKSKVRSSITDVCFQ